MKSPNKFEVSSPLPYPFFKCYSIPFGDEIILHVIATCEPDGWDHVSVSLNDRCPTWDEMCFIKALFFEDEDLCIQFHPKKSEYINAHAYCLHIWYPPVGNYFIITRN